MSELSLTPAKMDEIIRQAHIAVENHVETAANKLYDVTVLLRLSEQRGMSTGGGGMSTGDWVKLSRVVRHALAEVTERLCSECSAGDCLPLDMRKRVLEQRVQQLALKQAHQQKALT